VPREDQELQNEKLAQLKNSPVFTLDKDLIERTALRKDGQKFPVEFSVHVLDLHGERIATSIIRDITAHKKAENQLRVLSSQITKLEELERRRFAEFLHDQIGQLLFVTKIKLESLLRTESYSKNGKTAKEILSLISQMIENTRSLTFEISPPVLYQLGLEKALEELTEKMSKQYDLVISFEDDHQPKLLNDEISIILYRSVRELLMNTIKHAKAQMAKITTLRNGDEIWSCAEDDGIGFRPLDEKRKEGFGLFSISERLSQLGGHLKVDSLPNQGTHVTLKAPLKNKSNAL
jgi:signal transduction histidine kinase